MGPYSTWYLELWGQYINGLNNWYLGLFHPYKWSYAPLLITGLWAHHVVMMPLLMIMMIWMIMSLRKTIILLSGQLFPDIWKAGWFTLGFSRMLKKKTPQVIQTMTVFIPGLEPLSLGHVNSPAELPGHHLFPKPEFILHSSGAFNNLFATMCHFEPRKSEATNESWENNQLVSVCFL